MAEIRLENIYKIYDKENEAVKDFNLHIKDKEFIVFVGPSGWGKSTTLLMIAGLEEISKGELYIDDQLMNDVEPKDRDIAMVFQSYALYPHMTVFENMAFGLKLAKVPKQEVERRVNETAAIEVEESLGAESYIHSTVNGQSFITKVSGETHFTVGKEYNFSFQQKKLHFFDTVSEQAIPSESLKLAKSV